MPREKKSIISLVQKKKNMYMPFPTLPLLKPVSVLLEVPFSIFVSPFKSVSVNCDTESLGP